MAIIDSQSVEMEPFMKCIQFAPGNASLLNSCRANIQIGTLSNSDSDRRDYADCDVHQHNKHVFVNLEECVPGASRGVLLPTVVDEGTK